MSSHKGLKEAALHTLILKDHNCVICLVETKLTEKDHFIIHQLDTSTIREDC
jgi:hypothetical protein